MEGSRRRKGSITIEEERMDADVCYASCSSKKINFGRGLVKK
jgi:hypothetical protein